MLNAGLLGDPGYCEQLVELLRWRMKERLFSKDVPVWWDNLKFDVKQLSMEYGRWVQKHN